MLKTILVVMATLTFAVSANAECENCSDGNGTWSPSLNLTDGIYEGCEDGDVSFFSVDDPSDPDGDRTMQVKRTCNNGTYMTAEEQANYIYAPSSRCTKGFWTTTEYIKGRDYRVTYQCVNGKAKAIRKSPIGRQ